MSLFGDKQEQIFSFGVDDVTKSYMMETARWGKFLAIMGFIFLGLLILLGVLSAMFMSAFDTTGALPAGMNTAVVLIYIVIALIYAYPTWALYKFSVLSKQALQVQNQQQFNESLRYLKNVFKFFGIVTILMLAIYGIGIVFGIFGAIIASV